MRGTVVQVEEAYHEDILHGQEWMPHRSAGDYCCPFQRAGYPCGSQARLICSLGKHLFWFLSR